MRITDIKAQVKRERQYSDFVEGKYSLSLSENELISSGIKIGQEFHEQRIQALKEKAIEDKALMRAYDLLARRPRSRWEMHEYLKRKDYPDELIEKILNTLSKRGYIDDKAFARSWIDSRRLLKKSSKRRLMLELQQKRISSDIISAVLAEDETDERQVIQEVIDKKRQQIRYKDDQKLIAYLLRQGFNYSDIKSVLHDSKQ